MARAVACTWPALRALADFLKTIMYEDRLRALADTQQQTQQCAQPFFSGPFNADIRPITSGYVARILNVYH